MTETFLLENIMRLIPLVLSLTVHEWAHAYSAFRLGDDTAARMGRLTLNPIPHIDPIGTLLLPLLGIPFGWAKPVPVNPANFDRKVTLRTGDIIVSAAGPFSNVVLAVICVLVFAVLYRFAPETVQEQRGLAMLLMYGFQINVLLAIFNMLPLPPLDGGHVANGLMPRRFRPQWERFAVYGPAVLLAIIFLPRMLNFSLFSWPMFHATNAAYAVIGAIVNL
jgi:Zn-dependent protease